MFCPNCGSQMHPEAVICPNCGMSVKKDNTSKVLIAIIITVIVAIIGVLIFCLIPNSSSDPKPVNPTAVVVSPTTTEPTTVATTAAPSTTQKVNELNEIKIVVIDPYNISGSRYYGNYIYSGRVNTPNNILYLRSGPSTGYSILAKMKHNSLIDIYGVDGSGEWYYVRYENQYGWANANYIR